MGLPYLSTLNDQGASGGFFLVPPRKNERMRLKGGRCISFPLEAAPPLRIPPRRVEPSGRMPPLGAVVRDASLS